MKANAGGNIAPDDIIGRDALISELWSILTNQSLVLSSERRTGKTCILKKMASNAKDGFLPIYRDLELVHSTAEFVEIVVQDLDQHLPLIDRTVVKGRQLKKAFQGFQLGSVKVPETNTTAIKTILVNVINKAAVHSKRTLVLLWDELPMMLDNIRQNVNEQAAMELLDTLRAVRQQCPQVRMVFTGSIGIHHVLSVLKDSGYTNDSTNDMLNQEVPALEEQYSRQLALGLLAGEHINTTDNEVVSSEIAKASCFIPYFTHHIVTEMRRRGTGISSGTASEIVHGCIRQADDPWHLNHYHDRLKTYYSKLEQPIAESILDVLAAANEPLTTNEVYKLVQSKMNVSDKIVFLKVMRLLELDHYITKAAAGTICFKVELIKEWWQTLRGDL